jgi:hypothetical protein
LVKLIVPFLSVDCDFDKGNLCEWKDDKADDFDWIVRKGRTPTSNTGPDSDRGGKGQ